MTSPTMPQAGSSTTYTSGWPKNQNRCCHSTGSPPLSGSKKPVCRVWSNTSMIAPATSGPTEAMNRMLATTIIHTTIGMSYIFMPGAREFIAVVMKLIPPSKKATNSRATAMTHSVEPNGVRLYCDLADNGGYAVQAPPKPPPGTKNEM